MNGFLLIGVYLLVINITLFIIMGVDKRQAVKRLRRVSEKTIWLLAWAGGAAGGFAGMEVFRHKTKHSIFKTGMPAIMIVQAGVLIWYVLF
ncbi:DUF1294 domain-containing protein [Halobacillus sp. Marseille-P3879]|uniref:DUF1294 domain-containing protein n=1 Tax=Halobacillus sp. Marseille-P3879 TaxID=2045014 RepID=UPI000C7AE9CE|nr:DUF1294 domain-containing protein [Halobacillus sp. Marseille-P3879]